VVLLNGVAGAVVKAKLNLTTVVHPYCPHTTKGFVTIWLNPAELLPGHIDCFFDNLRVHFDPATRTYYDTEGVTLDFSFDFGGVGGLEYLDPDIKFGSYFHDVIVALGRNGYAVGKNLHAAPYDWRLAADGLATKPATESGLPYFTNLRRLIEGTVGSNGQPAMLVAHSMGALVALTFLNDQTPEWKAKHIQTFVAISPPFAGSPKALKAAISGDTLGYPLEHHFLRPIQSTSASGLWMFPQAALWPVGHVLVQTPHRNYTTTDYLAAMKDLGLQQAVDMLEAGVHDLVLPKFRAPGVAVHVIHGSQSRTEAHFIYGEDFCPDRVPPRPHIDYDGDGDGTVPLHSLTRASVWATQQRPPVNITAFPGEDHFGILSSKKMISFLLDVLTGNPR